MSDIQHFFTPIDLQTDSYAETQLGKLVNAYNADSEFPDLTDIDMAIIGVCEDRRATNNVGCSFAPDKVRDYFYSLYPGTFRPRIVDLGNITAGHEIEDTYYAVKSSIDYLIRNNVIPIIIGGGHNNAYGNIKGLALAKGKPVNAINFDAHTDFRILEGRHSGNGFSYAFEDGFLKKYFVFGLHENFVSKSVFNTLKELTTRVKFVTYEELEVKREKIFETELEEALEFIKNEPFGVELDLDAIPGIPSSAMTLSGLSVDKARNYIYFMGKHANASYLHICEGAPELDDSKNNHLTGKLIAAMITDFMKAKAL